jgi:CRISPR-associated endoribonuclease Cas6
LEFPLLTSLKLTLRSHRPETLPPFLGRAARAVLLKLIAADDPALAEQLHTPNQRRPYTCSTIWGAPIRRGSLVVEPDDGVHLRYTGLTAPVSAQLRRLAQDPPPHIDVEGARLRIEGATLDPDEDRWAGATTYEALADGYLLASKAPARRAKLRFASPTAFRSGGQTVPVPLPGLVYGSLVDTWNAFSPVTVSEEARRFGEECLAISRYRLSTRTVSGKGGSVHIGFVGACQYTALRRDRYWQGVIQLLTDYAFYAGVGYRTTAGMGQTRRA